MAYVPTSQKISQRIDLIHKALAAAQSSRADFVTLCGIYTPPIGTLVPCEGIFYRYIGSGTAIADLPGWVPHLTIWTSHWGVDLTGATDDSAKITAAFVYAKGKTLNLDAGILNWTYAASIAIDTASTRVIGAGIGATILRMAVPSTTFAAAFQWSASNCRFADLTFQFPTLAASQSAFANFSGNDNRFDRVRWVGGVTGSGTASHTTYVLNISTTLDIDGLKFVDCEEDGVSYGFLKSNANTRSTKRVSIIRGRSKNCYKSPMASLNSPMGVLQDVEIIGGHYEQDVSRGSFPIGIGIATGKNAVIANVHGRGVWGDFIHLEEKVRNLSISGVTAEMQGGNFITLTSNNNGGSWWRPEQVSISNINAEQTGSQTGNGLQLSFDANSISSANNVVANGGTLTNFAAGIQVGCRGDDNIRLQNFNLINCAVGVQYTGDGLLDVEGFTFSGCTTAITSTKGGVASRPTFFNCTDTHSVTAGILQIRDGAWNIGLQVFTAGQTRYFRLLKRVRRAQATGTIRAYQGTVNRHTAVHTLIWDGTTESGGQLQTMTGAGSIIASLKLIDEASAVAIAAGGTGYTVGDVLTVSGGTPDGGGTRTTATVTTVSAGVVTGVTLTNAGEWATVPANPAATTGGTGTGCTLTLATIMSLCASVFDSAAHTVAIEVIIDGSVFVI